jgi:hypothetical protein
VQLQYTDGEVHRYLGRPLRLRLTEGRTRRVSVLDHFFDLRCSRPDDAGMVKQVLETFYRSEAKRLLPGRVSLCLARFQQPLPVPQLSIRKLLQQGRDLPELAVDAEAAGCRGLCGDS